MAAIAGPCDCHHLALHVLSLNYHLLALCQGGLGFCGPYPKPFVPTPFSLAACSWSVPADSGLPLLLREPQGQLLSVLLMFPRHGNLSSGCWEFPDEEAEQAQGQWPLATMALGYQPKRRE